MAHYSNNPTVISAANKLGITPEQYVAKREAGLKWCYFTGHWIEEEGNFATADGICIPCRRQRDREAYARTRG